MKIKSLATLCSILALSASLEATAAPAFCKAPRVLVVLDRSSSMVTGKVGGQTKWEVAKQALKTVLNKYQSTVDFGLMLFPDPNQCGGGSVKQGIGPDNATAILSHLTTPPKSGNWTPMAQSLDIAAKVKNLQDTAYSNYVLLITDGWQWCSPYDASTRFLPVNSTANLTSLGITTYVVGFGDSVDTLTLNKMAAAAKTKVSKSCNVKGTDSKAKDNCYYQANDPQALLTALQKIAKLIAAEKCDGQDNDCDGSVDEGLLRTCSNTCGTGQETCSNGSWGSCTAPQPTTEVCDGKDNDCDGSTDEGCSCVDGNTRACGVTKGQCTAGTQTCASGAWGSCSGGTQASAEVCDGLDNDCDGSADENLSRACQSACGVGTETCSGGSWAGCTAPQPSTEICDGLDNDCDSATDEGVICPVEGQVCVNGACVAPPDPGLKGGDLEDAAGCDCQVSFAPKQRSMLSLAALLAVALLLLRRRRA